MADLRGRLLLLREATGESQAELGRTLGAGQQTVWGWENGRVQPNWRMLVALADHYGVSVDYLVGRTDDPAPPRQAASRPPSLARWLREALVARRLTLAALAEAAAVPLAVLIEIQEGTASGVPPAHLRALARYIGAEEDDVLKMARQPQAPAANADTTGRVAASSLEGLTEHERRQVEDVIRGIRERRRELGDPEPGEP